MFKKLNAYLITRYPLIWNTRVAFVLPLILMVQGFFYLAGYAQLVDFIDLKSEWIFDAEEVILFSCLMTVVILLIWLVYYLRNNPLKAHYPISKGYMFGEFILLFFVFFSSATFFLTYKQGLYDQTKRLTSATDLIEEANTINLAYHFIPLESEAFRPHRSCDSIKAREERREKRMLIYEEAQKRGEQIDYDYIDYEPATYSDSDLPNYLNYCGMTIGSLDTGKIASGEENSKRVATWLKEGRKDSVRHVLTRFQKLLDKYDASYGFDAAAVADSVFSHPNFSVGAHFFNVYRDNEEPGDEWTPYPHVNSYDLTSSISTIEEIREGFWDYDILLAMLYYALGAAIVLYSFRMMKVRIWFAALIGVGLWAIVLGLVFTLSNMQDKGTLYVLLFLFFVFISAAIGIIRSKGNKFISGLAYLWAIWMQLSALPMLVVIVMESYRHDQRIINTHPGYRMEEVKSPVYTWLEAHMDAIFTANLGLFLILLILVYIPLARKWQANPEE